MLQVDELFPNSKKLHFSPYVQDLGCPGPWVYPISAIALLCDLFCSCVMVMAVFHRFMFVKSPELLRQKVLKV